MTEFIIQYVDESTVTTCAIIACDAWSAALQYAENECKSMPFSTSFFVMDPGGSANRFTVNFITPLLGQKG